MHDKHPQLRVHGLRLSEKYPELLPNILKMADDPQVMVAFQASLSIGNFYGPEVQNTLEQLINKYGRNPWFETAILSARKEMHSVQKNE